MMRGLRVTLKRLPIIGDVLVFLYRRIGKAPVLFFRRAKSAIGYFIHPLRELVVWWLYQRKRRIIPTI